MSTARRRARGFTLIELLVAMTIVAIIGVMALGGLNEVIRQQEAAQDRSARWREIQLAMRIIVQDLSQIHPRPMREEQGQGYVAALYASPLGQFAVELSRGGWSNPAGFPRGSVLRVAYDIEEDTLVRYYWPVLDRTLSTPPLRNELLGGLTQVEFRFMDSQGEWHVDWPPVTASGSLAFVMRPKVIEVAFEFEDFGRVSRLVEAGG